MYFFRTAYYGVLVALMPALAGCSEGEPDNVVDFGPDGAELSLSLQFNSNPTSRALTLENGTEAESKVQSVTVYLFDGTSQDAVCLGRQEAVIQQQEDVSGTEVERVVKVHATNENVYKTKGVVVVVNEPSVFYGDGNAKEKYKRIFGEQAPRYGTDVTEVATDGKFVMTNSNYVDASGNETFITPVSTSNWAVSGSGQTTTPLPVYVERIAAKVDLTWGNPTVTADADVEFKGWGLNVLNTAYYPVKYLNTGFLDTYKSLYSGSNRWPGISNTSIWNNIGGHRSYWAVDPNYLSNSGLLLQDISKFCEASGTSVYCLENTMSYDHQRRNESTCAIIVATYVPKTLDFSAETDKKTWFIWNNRYYTTSGLIAAVYDVLPEKYGITTGDLEIVKGSELKIGDNVVGYTSYKVNVKAGVAPDGITIDELNALLDGLFASNAVQCYWNGYCYYEIPIKQLADQVPWNSDEKPNQKWHQGRYGVVRNHNYKLNVKSVNNLGNTFTSRTIDNPESDDIATFKLDVSVSVLKWTVRTQFVDL